MTDEREAFLQQENLPEALRGSVGFLLNDVASLIRSFSAEALAPLGISPRQASIFLALSERKAYSQLALSEMLGIDRTSMGAFLTKLEASELVRRQINPEDRRVYTVSLTPAGETLAAQVDQIVKETQAHFLGSLTSVEGEQLRSLLLTLRQAHLRVKET